MEIFKLVGSIMVDSAEAEKSISKTGDEASGLGEKLSNGIKTAAKWGTAVAGAAVAAGTAMVAAAKDTAADLDVIDKASQRMGIAAESYQELAYAAGLSGVNMSTMEKAAKKLEGTDLNLDDALDQILALGTAEERTAAACELFGETVAYQMEPLLNVGAEGMASMKQEAHDLGLVMSQDTVTQGAAMNDMFSKVEQSIATLKNGLVADLMPYVMDILQWVIDNVPRIKDTVSKMMDAIIPIVKPILNGIMDLLGSFSKLFDGDVRGFVDGILSFLRGMVSAFLAIGRSIFSAVWDGMASVWNGISSWVSEKVSWLADKLFFWRSGRSEMNSHAGGLPYVPYDNYPAMLHRGESVMTASDSQSLLQAVKSIAENGVGGGDINITVESVLDGNVIGRSVTRYQKNQARAWA